MKIVKDTTKLHFNRWHDPGDYPNSLAGGPLPSYTYLDDVTGVVQVELDEEDMPEEKYTEDVEEIHWPELFDLLNQEMEFKPTKVNIKWLTPNLIEVTFTDWEWEEY